MMLQVFEQLFIRELDKLRYELLSFETEEMIWQTVPGIKNSAGHLCLHLAGNLQTYIGAVMGNTGYIRNRELEFSAAPIPREDLVQLTATTSQVISLSLQQLTEAELEKEYPLLVLDKKTSTGFFLSHLLIHTGYHIGQINYLRRMLSE